MGPFQGFGPNWDFFFRDQIFWNRDFFSKTKFSETETFSETKFFKTETETFYSETKFSESETEALKDLAKVLKPRSFEIEMSISAPRRNKSRENLPELLTT